MAIASAALSSLYLQVEGGGKKGGKGGGADKFGAVTEPKAQYASAQMKVELGKIRERLFLCATDMTLLQGE